MVLDGGLMQTFYVYYLDGGEPDVIKAISYYWSGDGVVVFDVGKKLKPLTLHGVDWVE